MKSFEQFREDNRLIVETPTINSYFDHKNFDRLVSKPTTKALDDLPDKTKIGENEYVADYGSGKAYMHIPNGKVESYSIINGDDEHVNTSKNGDQDSTHIQNFIKYHAKKHGRVFSDNSQTDGSKSLWEKLINTSDSNSYTFHHHHKSGVTDINPNDLENLKSKLWTDNNFSGDRLEIRKCQK